MSGLAAVTGGGSSPTPSDGWTPQMVTILLLVLSAGLGVPLALSNTEGDYIPSRCVYYAHGEYLDSTFSIGSTLYTLSIIDSVFEYDEMILSDLDDLKLQSAQPAFRWSTSNEGFDVLGLDSLAVNWRVHPPAQPACLTQPVADADNISLADANAFLKGTKWNLRSP